MGPASLPRSTGQVRRDRIDQTTVCIGGDQPDPAQTAGDQVGEEGVPCRTGLAGGHVQAQHFAVPVGVDSGGDHRDCVHDLLVLADFHRQCVGGDERERARVIESALPERGDLFVEVFGHA